MLSSSFRWLDYSEHERRKAFEVIALFHEQDTRDELGIRPVRDAFADLFFPGTSTIQTRAGYFLFVPWIYLDLEGRRVSSREIAGRARAAEVKLIDALAGSADTDGTIGIDARASLQRLPSNIYWQGLGVWGIRIFPGSQDEYRRSLDSFYLSRQGSRRNDDGEPVEGATLGNWHYALPEPPAAFPKEASFRLRKEDSEYLRERVMARAPGTLLAFLLDQGRAAESGEFAWQHPQSAEFPLRIREQLEHGRSFSEVIHGAALLYNLMLSESSQREQLVADYREALQAWGVRLDERREALISWDRHRFWEIVDSTESRVRLPTRRFVNSWLDLALSVRGIADDHRARELIDAQERIIKRDQARLHNTRALERWSGAAGTAQLNYRWRVSKKIIADIITGLSGEERHAESS